MTPYEQEARRVVERVWAFAAEAPIQNKEYAVEVVATALDAARWEQLLEIAASFDDAAVMTDHWDYAAHCARWARRFRKQADAIRQREERGEDGH